MPSASRPNFALLDRLRARFLGSPATGGDYWESNELLEAYDTTFAERIGWKWDAVLAELKRRGWSPPAGAVLDWGCGSGVAGRRVVRAFSEHGNTSTDAGAAKAEATQTAGAGKFSKLIVHDRSPLARKFAARQARETFPNLLVEEAPDWGDLGPTQPFTLVISHVLNELPPAESAALLALVRRAAAVIWVEPGTSEVASTLVALREELRSEFALVAPCTHQAACGLLTPENQQHWCHHFAKPPIEAFTSAFWSDFSRQLGIDLRSLPYSFLVLDRARAEAPTPPGWSRVLGEPREFKGHHKVLSCEAIGVHERTMQKRDDSALFKQLRRLPAPPVFAWEIRDEKIVGGKTWPRPDDAASAGDAEGSPDSAPE